MKDMIWSNGYDAIKEIADDLRCENPEMSEDEAWSCACELNDDYLSDERANLNVRIGDLIVIADLGLWNGRRKAYKVIPNATLADAISVAECDFIDWYVEDGEMKIDDVHHDGTNHYLFRTWKDGIKEFHKGLTLHLIANGFDGKEDLDVDTRPLGADVANVYGWEE